LIKSGKNNGFFYEAVSTFVIISRFCFLRREMFSIKFVVKNQNTNFMFKDSPPPPPPQNCAVFQIMWKNIAGRTRHDYNITRRRKDIIWIPDG